MRATCVFAVASLITSRAQRDRLTREEAARRYVVPMATDRRAEVTWRGNLLEGSGKIGSTTSGAFGGLGVTWKARSEDETGGLTSPEELIAAAHAACFSMALSNGLAKDGHAPDELHTSATVTFQPGEGITRIALTVEGRVPGLDDATFQQAAQTAKENCPVSKALAGVPEISLTARLAG
jgi:lipoyl-dependent peroxiredoxin